MKTIYIAEIWTRGGTCIEKAAFNSYESADAWAHAARAGHGTRAKGQTVTPLAFMDDYKKPVPVQEISGSKA